VSRKSDQLRKAPPSLRLEERRNGDGDAKPIPELAVDVGGKKATVVGTKKEVENHRHQKREARAKLLSALQKGKRGKTLRPNVGANVCAGAAHCQRLGGREKRVKSKIKENKRKEARS